MVDRECNRKCLSLKKHCIVGKQVFSIFDKSWLEKVFFITNFYHLIYSFPNINKSGTLEASDDMYLTKN